MSWKVYRTNRETSEGSKYNLQEGAAQPQVAQQLTPWWEIWDRRNVKVEKETVKRRG